LIPKIHVRCLILILVLLNSALFSQDSSLRLNRAKSLFIFPQLNLSYGYCYQDESQWGWQRIGARNQIVLNMMKKSETRMKRGYTSFAEPKSFQLKFAIVDESSDQDSNDLEFNFKLLDSWMKIDTKWDRTEIVIGHKSIPYGHNPTLDSSFSFLPSLSNLDLGFSRDKGIFFSMPVNNHYDFEISVSAGMGDTFDYYGGWLVTSRFGRAAFHQQEWGLFALGGSIQKTCGSKNISSELNSFFRIGSEYLYKKKEFMKIVNQISIGSDLGNTEDSNDDVIVYQFLQNVEFFIADRWSMGYELVHKIHASQENSISTEVNTIIRFSISYAACRYTKIRLNSYYGVGNSLDQDEFGVFLQITFGRSLTN